MGASGAPAATAAMRADRPARAPDSIVLRLSGRIRPDDAERLGARAAKLLAVAGLATVVCDVRDVLEPDASALDALCRIRLAARRRSCHMILRGAPDRLVELVELMGLPDILPPAAEIRSGVETGR